MIKCEEEILKKILRQNVHHWGIRMVNAAVKIVCMAFNKFFMNKVWNIPLVLHSVAVIWRLLEDDLILISM